eukprot:TRINITY_DN17184_c0_g1_i1.p2 TRINITY_DN17184_c0_g1~~TRINITY_DN17184_c0_g1_i1.p2  ORF type:complete len:216 (+),score=48.63 TRINITY_DN17184_c0_g1_i1:397-1044(+)
MATATQVMTNVTTLTKTPRATSTRHQPNHTTVDLFVDAVQSRIVRKSLPLVSIAWVRNIVVLLLCAEVMIALSTHSMGTMYGVAGCGLFRCEHWFYDSPAYNEDCGARARYTKVAQLSWSGAVWFLTSSLPMLLQGRYPPTSVLLSAAGCALICAICSSQWFHIDVCNNQFSAGQDSHIGACAPVNLVAAVFTAFIALLRSTPAGKITATPRHTW